MGPRLDLQPGLVDFVMMLSAAYLLFRKKALMRMNYEEALEELQAPSALGSNQIVSGPIAGIGGGLRYDHR
jgi:hypothetical protein